MTEGSSKYQACAVIVHFGDPAPTVEAVRRLEAYADPPRIAVVANDCSPEPAELESSSATWLRPASNLGFAGGCAFGASSIPAVKYAFLNADVFLEESGFRLCLDALNRDDVGVAGPLLRFPDGRLQSACGYFTPGLGLPYQSRQQPTEPLADCEWITGAALFTRSDVLESTPLDPSYFLLYEDADFCYRAHRAGWRTVVASEAGGIHLTCATIPGSISIYYGARNRVLFLRRTRPWWAAVFLTLGAMFRLPRMALADLLFQRTARVPFYVRAIVHAWTVAFPPMRLHPYEPLAYGRGKVRGGQAPRIVADAARQAGAQRSPSRAHRPSSPP